MRTTGRAIIAAMGLSSQHARVVELVLGDFTNKQIADAMNIGEGTVKDYLKRISQRTGTRGRVQLAVHVMAISHEVLNAWATSAKMASNQMASNGAACDVPTVN